MADIVLGTNGYCEVSDVVGINQHRTYDGSSHPTTSQIGVFITEGFHEINGYLDALGYSTPVPTTATKASKLLKKMSSNQVAARCEDAAYAVGMNGQPERIEFLLLLYSQPLEDLKKGTLVLSDASRGDDSPVLTNEETPDGDFRLDADGDEEDPVVDMDTKF